MLAAMDVFNAETLTSCSVIHKFDSSYCNKILLQTALQGITLSRHECHLAGLSARPTLLLDTLTPSRP